MIKLQALGAGLVGATTVTLIHESVRRVNPDAPRMDVLGMRAIAKILGKTGANPPTGERLHRLALIGDLISNTLYYSMVAKGDDESVWQRGALLGLSAGIGGVALPSPMGLGSKPSARTPQTQLMTVLWYLAGGLAAAAASRAFAASSD